MRRPVTILSLVAALASAPLAQVEFGPHQGEAFLHTEGTSEPGGRLAFHHVGRPNRPVLLAVSDTSQALQTPFGMVWFGPRFTVPWALLSGPDGTGQKEIVVPDARGLELHVQGIEIGPRFDVQLTNLVRVKIGGAPLVWHEDFESAPANSYPKGWTAAVGNRVQYVDTFQPGEGKHSFRIEGGRGCWAGGSSIPIDPAGRYANDFTLDFLVRAGNNTQTGCHRWFRIMAWVKAKSKGRWILLGRPDGDVDVEGLKGGRRPMSLMKWFRVQIRYTRVAKDLLRLRYTLDGEPIGQLVLPALPDEDTARTLGFTSAEGPIWIDDVKLHAGFAPRR